MRRTWTVGLVVALLTAATASAAVFQWAVPVKREKGEATAFLWIPPEARQVRGVIISGMTLMEREMSKDPLIRKACADQQLAIVFMNTGLSSTDLQVVLDDLAKASGYQELSVAPLMFVGHSAGGPQAFNRAREMADRCFGLVQYRGGGPGGGEGIPANIPALMMVGQFDEFGGTMRNAEGFEQWQRSQKHMAEYRAKDEANLGILAVEPGAGHFAWSDRAARLLAVFVRKAAEAKIPQTWPTDAKSPPKLKAIDPATGWLSDLTLQKPEHKPAPYGEYAGDKANAAWLFDREMAMALEEHHKGLADGKKDQFIKWNDGYWVDAGTRYFFTGIKWVDDGATFEVHPVYADVYLSPVKGNGPRWADSGKPVGHSNAPIKVKAVSGPVKAVGDHKFRMHYDALMPATEGSRVTFMAYSEGDAEYRYTEQVGMMPRGFKGLTKGKDQTITFPELSDMKASAGSVELKATSDADLPVEYYVAYGPAKVEEGRLVITEIPPRASYPIEVKVVAWQFGSGVEPFVKTAAPVERTFKITGP